MGTLDLFADQIRLETCKMLKEIGYGHLGGALSIVEVLAVLFGQEMKLDPKNENKDEQDRFVLSKGHGGTAYYATLALLGYFPVEELKTMNSNGTNLPSHPDRLKTKGVDVTTGSLGQGISLAAGLAKAFSMDKKNNHVYVIVGDGECNEGQIWEAMQFIAHHKLVNLTIFIDENKKQLDGYTKNILDPMDLSRKVEAFGFYCERVNGKSTQDIAAAVARAKIQNQVTCIILETKKGQGIPYFESMDDNHHIRFQGESLDALNSAIEQLQAKVVEQCQS